MARCPKLLDTRIPRLNHQRYTKSHLHRHCPGTTQWMVPDHFKMTWLVIKQITTRDVLFRRAYTSRAGRRGHVRESRRVGRVLEEKLTPWELNSMTQLLRLSARVLSATRAAASSGFVFASLPTRIHSVRAMSSDKSYPIPVASRLIDGRALQQDVWSVFK